MVYYDQRGCGRSEDSPDKDYSNERMVKDIEQIRCYYKQDKVFLLSHSFGGILSVNYALHYPEHVKALILANCTLNMKYSMTQQIRYMDTLVNRDFTTVPDEPALLLNTFMHVRQALPENLSYKVLSDNEESVQALEKIDEKNHSDCEFAQKAFALPEYWQDFTAVSKNIAVPVLILTGEKDHSVGPDHYVSFRFPNETIRKIDGGHLLYYEKSKEFKESIISFVRNLD